MHNVWLIAKREYMERVRTKGFILATVLIPCLWRAGRRQRLLHGAHQDHLAHRCRHLGPQLWVRTSSSSLRRARTAR